MDLNVLLVEDDPSDMKAFVRDLPEVFTSVGITAKLLTAETFEKAFGLIDSSEIRFDLIISDTFRGQLRDRDAAVIQMVNKYRGKRFCPLVVFSASAKPADLELGAFVVWADKAVHGDIASAITKVLATGIPQLARKLHDELDVTAGGFLWSFLETNWDKLWQGQKPDISVVERLVRRRAALQFAEMTMSGSGATPLASIAGLEYYIYPPLVPTGFNLGHVVRNRINAQDIRVVLTPHCHLTIQQGQQQPRAEYVLTTKTVAASTLLGQKLTDARTMDEQKQDKKLKTWATPPSRGEIGKPEGRYWYLPGFLEIPHSYCDFQQLESLSYDAISAAYQGLAVLTPPFAESLQACFVSYHAAVGIPNINPQSIRTMFG
jgi:hypothetical protein